MKLVRERLDFNREGDPKQKIGIGHKRPGQPKTFEEAEKYDDVLDYNEEGGELIAKLRANVDQHDWDEEALGFLLKYDDTGAMDGYVDMVGLEKGDTEDLIAVNSDDGNTYVFTYGPDGAVAVW